MHVVLRQVVGHARQAGVHIATAQVFGAHHLARGGLHQRWATQKDGALVLDDDRFIAHCGHVGAACRARAHHHGDLTDAHGAHVGLVEEDAAEVVAVGENLVLVGQVGAARVHQVDTGQVVLLRHLLGTQVLLDGERVVGAALHGGVVAHDHAVHAAHAANACDEPGTGCVVVVHVQRGQRGQFEERRAGVQQHLHALAGQQLAPRGVLGACRFAAALGDLVKLGAQVIHQRAHGGGVGQKVGRAGVELGVENHASSIDILGLRSATGWPVALKAAEQAKRGPPWNRLCRASGGVPLGGRREAAQGGHQFKRFSVLPGPADPSSRRGS